MDKLRKMFAFLDAMYGLGVTGNSRLTFCIDGETQICDVNLEDYY